MKTEPESARVSSPNSRAEGGALEHWFPLLLVVLAAAAYANSFRVPFYFDDWPSIVDNISIRKLGTSFVPPADFGLTVSGRPLLNVSLALNHAISGLDPWSYHALNLLIHVGAGLALWGVLRRTFRRPAVGPALQKHAEPAAAVAASLWILHPLQTESVTYVIQRAESLMGLFFLLMVYAFVRAVESPRPLRWQIFGVAMCLLGVASKEVIATAPLLLLLYDRTFVAGSFAGAWRARRDWYLALAACWLPLAGLIASTGGDRGGTFSTASAGAWVRYWLTQTEAVTRYLQLAVWPHPLVIDYGPPRPPAGGALIAWALPVAALLGATVYALVRRPVWGFAGAWFLAILAPTSLMPGVNQAIVEHRLYLPLAAIVAAGVGILFTVAGARRGGTIGLAAVLLAAGFTARRNHDYRDALSFWGDAVAKWPRSSVSEGNLGAALLNAGRYEEASSHARAALRIDPTQTSPHYNLGLALGHLGRHAEALENFREVVRLNPRFFHAHHQAGLLLQKIGRTAEAREEFERTLAIQPHHPDALFQLGVLAAGAGRWPEAIACYEAVLARFPDNALARLNLGVAHSEAGDQARAATDFAEALRLDPTLAPAHFYLGMSQSRAGDEAGARERYREAARLKTDYVEPRINLGISYAREGRLEDALRELDGAVALDPRSAPALANLGNVLSELDRTADAIARYEAALRIEPANARTHFNLAQALIKTARLPEALGHFDEAARLDPAWPEPRAWADRVRAALR